MLGMPIYSPPDGYRRKPDVTARPYLTHPIARGLSSAWLFNESCGQYAFEHVYGNSFSVPASVFNRVNGPFGKQSVDFQGGGGVTPVTQAGLTPPSITVLQWICLKANQQSKIFLCNFRASINNGWATGISDSTNNIVKWYTATSATSNTIFSTTTLSNFVWYQVVGTFDGATKNLYINGKLEATASWANAIDYTSTVVRFGELAGGITQRLNAYFDHCLVWSRALTAGEIQELYAKPFLLHRPPDSRSEQTVQITIDVTSAAPSTGAQATWEAPTPGMSLTVESPSAGAQANWNAITPGFALTVASPEDGAEAVWNAPTPDAAAAAFTEFPQASAVWNSPTPSLFVADNLIAVAPAALTNWNAIVPEVASDATSEAPSTGAQTNWNATTPSLRVDNIPAAWPDAGAQANWNAIVPEVSIGFSMDVPAAQTTWNSVAPTAGGFALNRPRWQKIGMSSLALGMQRTTTPADAGGSGGTAFPVKVFPATAGGNWGAPVPSLTVEPSAISASSPARVSLNAPTPTVDISQPALSVPAARVNFNAITPSLAVANSIIALFQPALSRWAATVPQVGVQANLDIPSSLSRFNSPAPTLTIQGNLTAVVNTAHAVWNAPTPTSILNVPNVGAPTAYTTWRAPVPSVSTQKILAVPTAAALWRAPVAAVTTSGSGATTVTLTEAMGLTWEQQLVVLTTTAALGFTPNSVKISGVSQVFQINQDGEVLVLASLTPYQTITYAVSL